MAGIDGGNYSKEYLDLVNQTFERMDNKDRGGNGDGKVQVNEALKDLNLPDLISGQNKEEASKLSRLTKNIPEILSKYAGEDGEFSAQEWADFINGEEWGAVLDAWHSSSKKAQIEMNWIDNAHMPPDGKTTKGEVKVGILNNLESRGINVDTSSIEKLIDKYAGEDGIFTLEEYQQMKQDPEYKEFIEKYNVIPWFTFEDQKDNTAGFNQLG